MKRASVWLITFLFFVSVGAYAQGGGNSAITGTVTDPSGAVVPKAKVTVVQEQTSVTRSTVANSSGQFNVPSLDPGTYRVSVEATGFKKNVQSFTLLADQIRSLQIHLQLGQASQVVNVEAASVQVNTVTPVLSQVIDQSRVVNLPLNGRNAADLTLLVPGTTTASGHGTQQGNTKQIPGAESISVNGARPDQISYNLDGANNEDLMSNTNNPFPFPDALQEFSVQTNSFSAQYGTNAGAVLNVVTKSGTNQWHGDAFEFVRNKVFNARNYFAPTVDPLKRNQFGGTIGGPIKKGKSFIFFGYQGTRVRTVGNAHNAIIPTAANLTGDFSAYESATNPANPLGKVVQINDPSTGQPYAGDVGIPVSPVAVAMSKFLPINQASADGRITYGASDVENYNEYISRFDQVVRGQDKLFVRFFLDRYTHQPPYDGKNLLTVGAGSTVQTQNYAVGYTWVPSPTLVNNLVVDVVRSASDRGQGGTVPQMTDFGSKIFQLPKAEGGIRSFGVSGFFGFGTFTDAKFIRNAADIRDQVTWTHGTHTIGFGGDFERDQSNVRNTDLENGSWHFSSDTTNLAMASFTMGYLRSFSQTSGNFSDSRENVTGLYVEDQWKVRPRLSLTLGLRWDPQSPMKEIRGRTEQFLPQAAAAGAVSKLIPTAPAGLFFVGDCYNSYCMPAAGETADLNNFAPRVGFAYALSGNGKTVIRGGAGTFYYTRLPGLFLNDASISQPFSLRIDLLEGPSLGPLSDPLQNEQAFAAGFPQRFILSAVPKNVAWTPPVTAFSLEPGRKWVSPTTYDWNLTIEHQLRSDTLIRASYVGTRGVHLREDGQLNPAQYSLYVARNCGGPVAQQTGDCSTDGRRVYPGYSRIYMNMNNGMSRYNALQIDVEKRPSANSTGIFKNLTLLANYTYSKAMDIALASNGGITDVGSSQGSGMSFYNPAQGAFETGPSDFDHTHRLVASYVWALPRLTGSSNSFLKWTLGGWNWSGIFTAETGSPLTITAGTDQSKTALGGDRANFVGTPSQYGQTASTGSRAGCTGGGACAPWLNTSLFALPAVGTYGNVGKGAYRGPGRWNVDMGLMKTFYPLTSHENLRFQVRGDFFNFFNHSQFNNPNTDFSSGDFGGIRSAADPRIIQLAVKVFF